MSAIPKTRKVAIAIRPSLASGRALAAGVIRQAKRRAWELRLVDVADAAYAETVADLVRKGYDGLVVSELTDDTARLLSAAPLATVVIGRPDARLPVRRAKTLYVSNDDEAVGADGARYLMSLGRFRAFGFVAGDHPKSYCAAAREVGFLRTLATARHLVRVLSVEDADDRMTMRDKLGDALAQLEKPAAVMAATDQLAILVFEAARQEGIDVPRQLAVIGVDNDELLCELADPSLTSIEPDHVAEGELAARALDALMRGRRPPSAEKLVNRAHRIVERESARAIAPASHLVSTAQAFLADNFTKDIGVGDVVAHLRVSRRLADLRYRELTGESIYQAILRLRLEKAHELLTSTSLTIAKVIARCGFPDANSAARTFKRRFGVTMSAVRRQNPYATSAPSDAALPAN